MLKDNELVMSGTQNVLKRACISPWSVIYIKYVYISEYS